MKTIPTGVKVLAVLYFICAVIMILLGAWSIIGGSVLGSFLASIIPALGFLGAGLFIIMGIVAIAFGVLAIFIGIGLRKGQKWARILVIIFSILGLISGIMAMINGEIGNNIVGLVINLLIGSYLLFSQKVKNAFT